jgi:hypothetical protein
MSLGQQNIYDVRLKHAKIAEDGRSNVEKPRMYNFMSKEDEVPC